MKKISLLLTLIAFSFFFYGDVAAAPIPPMPECFVRAKVVENNVEYHLSSEWGQSLEARGSKNFGGTTIEIIEVNKDPVVDSKDAPSDHCEKNYPVGEQITLNFNEDYYGEDTVLEGVITYKGDEWGTWYSFDDIRVVSRKFKENLSERAQELSHNLKGRILLQVEDKGQAYYINPKDLSTYFLGRPADAFEVMRNQGLGISEENYHSFDGVAPERLAGRILLRVEASGEAYYVNPVDLEMYFLGRPADAFEIMRSLGLGVSDKDFDSLFSYAISPFLSDPYYCEQDSDCVKENSYRPTKCVNKHYADRNLGSSQDDGADMFIGDVCLPCISCGVCADNKCQTIEIEGCC